MCNSLSQITTGYICLVMINGVMFHNFQVNLWEILGWFSGDDLDDLGIWGEFWWQIRDDLVWFSDVGMMLDGWFPNHSFMNENVDKTADKWRYNGGRTWGSSQNGAILLKPPFAGIGAS